jgi:hypothetical protein
MSPQIISSSGGNSVGRILSGVNEEKKITILKSIKSVRS